MRTKSLTAVALTALTLSSAMQAWRSSRQAARAGAYESCYRLASRRDRPGRRTEQHHAGQDAGRHAPGQAGKAMRMGIETNSKTPAFAPRTFSISVLTPGQEYGRSLGETKTNYNDDIIMGWVGIGSQLDGLGHIGIDGTYYNCTKGATSSPPAGCRSSASKPCRRSPPAA
jgi:hypothetical protein